MISQIYEIDSNDQFRRAVKWIWLLLKELMATGCWIWVDYKLDNATSWTVCWKFDSSNQEYPKLNINRRGRKMQIRFRFYSTTTKTPKLTQGRVY
jgi:hypothetical protein